MRRTANSIDAQRRRACQPPPSDSYTTHSPAHTPLHPPHSSQRGFDVHTGVAHVQRSNPPSCFPELLRGAVGGGGNWGDCGGGGVGWGSGGGRGEEVVEVVGVEVVVQGVEVVEVEVMVVMVVREVVVVVLEVIGLWWSWLGWWWWW